jgi:hypothetical protein
MYALGPDSVIFAHPMSTLRLPIPFLRFFFCLLPLPPLYLLPFLHSCPKYSTPLPLFLLIAFLLSPLLLSILVAVETKFEKETQMHLQLQTRRKLLKRFNQNWTKTSRKFNHGSRRVSPKYSEVNLGTPNDENNVASDFWGPEQQPVSESTSAGPYIQFLNVLVDNLSTSPFIYRYGSERSTKV